MLFISHRTTDKAAAEDLRRRALACGYSAEQLFLDSDPESGIAAGEDWERVISDRLKKCQALIVVCSPRWAESKWCFAELVYAKTQGKLVFPVVIEKCVLDAVLGERQAVFVFREGEIAFERLWKSLEEHGLGPHEHRPWPPDHGDPCPFPGLDYFSDRFAPVYFGRQPEVADVLDQLKKMRGGSGKRLLLIHGGSGSGKSSLLRAGVLPRLDHHTGRTDWLVLPTLRYGETGEALPLLACLAQELAALFPSDAPSRPDALELRRKFESNNADQAARDFFAETQKLNLARGCHKATTLLSIDQFEELLTPTAGPSAQQFLTFLQALLSESNIRLLAIATLRSDYLDIYQTHGNALEPRFLEVYPLPLFPWERVLDVIVEPAARVGVTFTNELLERLKHDAPTSDALPLLAFTLEKLFRQCSGDNLIELAEYESLGGMTGAISQAVKNILPAKLAVETEQALRLSFVRHLMHVNEKDEFVRRPALWSALPAPAHDLLEEFVKQRLLHTSGTGEATTIEVSHESLFRCWPALTDWLADSARVLRWRRDVERDRKSAGKSWPGLTRAQLAVSRRWPREIPDELSPEESTWITQALRREFLFRGTIAAVILLITSLGGTAWYLRSVAIKSEAETKQANERNLEQLHKASMADHARAVLAWQENDTAEREGRWAPSIGHTSKWHEAVALWTHALENEPTNARASYWLYNTLLCNGHTKSPRLLHTFQNDGAPFSPSFSLDGLRVITISSDRVARVWDATTGSPLGKPLQHEGAVNRAIFSPDGGTVVTLAADRMARVWNAATGTLLGKPFKHEVDVKGATFSPDGSKVATISIDGMIRVLDTLTGDPLGKPIRHGTNAVSIERFSPDGTRVVTTSDDATAIVWDASTGDVIGKPLKHFSGSRVNSVTFSPDGKKVVTASSDARAIIWDVATGDWANDAPLPHAGAVRSAIFSRDGTLVVTVSGAESMIWDAATGNQLGEPLRQEPFTADANLSPDGTRIVTIGSDTARIWDIATGLTIGEPLRHKDRINSAAFSPHGAWIATSSQDKTVRIWETATGMAVGEPMRHAASVQSAIFNFASTHIITADENSTHVWEIASHPTQSQPLRHPGYVRSASYSLDGNRIITVSDFSPRSIALVWDGDTGERQSGPLQDYTGISMATLSHEESTSTVEAKVELLRQEGERTADVSKDGRKLVKPRSHSELQVWDISKSKVVGGSIIPVFYNPTFLSNNTNRAVLDSVKNTIISRRTNVLDASTGEVFFGPPDRPYVVILGFCPSSTEIDVAIWDTNTAKPIGSPLCHLNTVRSAKFSSDGTRLVTTGSDRKARIWNSNTGGLMVECLLDHDDVCSASFSTDDSRIAAASGDGTVQVFESGTGKSLGTLLRHRAGVSSVSFSLDDARIVTTSNDNTARIWEVPTKAEQERIVEILPGEPGVLDWAQAIAGLRFTKDGEMEVIPDDERRKVLEEVKLPPGPWAELAAWLKTSGPNRTISPKSKVTLRQIAERERDFGIDQSVSGTKESLESALKYDPTVPLARMMWANFMEAEELKKAEGERDRAVLARAAHWRRYDLDRLPKDDAKLWSRAAEILRDMPDAKVGVGPVPTLAKDEAEKAERKAAALKAKPLR